MNRVYTLLDLLSLAVYTFGAVTFTALTFFYWRERRRPATAALPLFTVVCAAAFICNLPLHLFSQFPIDLTREITAGLIPPIVLHIIWEDARKRWGRGVVGAGYAAAGVSVVLRLMAQSGVDVPAELAYRAPAILLALTSAAGLALRWTAPGRGTHRVWTLALLGLMLLCSAVANFGEPVGAAPDYLLLAFFCVSLYYRERLVFFDFLVKRGVFLAFGLMLVAGAIAVSPPAPALPWSWILLSLGCWLAGPFLYGAIAGLLDHRWLGRPYSPEEAERRFGRELQAASNETELQEHAERGLGITFRTQAEVEFNGPAEERGDECLAVNLEFKGTCLGHVRLMPRRNGVPFLSDDRHLLQSLAAALAMALENIRFRAERRAQEDREQQLRLLASRAELKALRAQINPHFLFNSLSVIAGLTHYRPALADEVIEQLAQVFRYTLRKSDAEWAPLAEEIAFVTAYLRIEQARFGDRLEVSLDVDPLAAGIAIPAMSIQPLVENAIKHGVANVEGRGWVALRAAFREGVLEVEVSDNGPGFPVEFALAANGEMHGLWNVAERLRGYYGDAARLSWGSGGDGTHVMLTLPAREYSRDTRSGCG